MLTARPKPSGARCNRVTWEHREKASNNIWAYLQAEPKAQIISLQKETLALYERIEKIFNKYRVQGILQTKEE